MKTQKRLAAQILNCSPKKVKFDETKLDEIKDAITKTDIRSLIAQDIIRKEPAKGTSRARARKIQVQKSKGRRRGHGSRKGASTARNNPKRAWTNKIRLQRSLLKHLKSAKIITNDAYREMYRKSKGGFFRSIRHLKIYIQERKLPK